MPTNASFGNPPFPPTHHLRQASALCHSESYNLEDVKKAMMSLLISDVTNVCKIDELKICGDIRILLVGDQVARLKYAFEHYNSLPSISPSSDSESTGSVSAGIGGAFSSTSRLLFAGFF